MTSQTPDAATQWAPLAVDQVVRLMGDGNARWWLSGGYALDRWVGASLRQRVNIDVSTTECDLPRLIAQLPAGCSAWVCADEVPVAGTDAPADVDVHPVQIRDDATGTWVLRVNVEDGNDRVWVYRRDPRLQLPWDRAVIDLDGVPTGAPEVQLVWKALRPRPEDDVDKDAVLPRLSDDARKWWERAILSIHPHSAWAIPVRSPVFPAKASWNRPSA